MGISIVVRFLIRAHDITLPLCSAPLISFSILWLSAYKPCPCLVRFTPTISLFYPIINTLRFQFQRLCVHCEYIEIQLIFSFYLIHWDLTEIIILWVFFVHSFGFLIYKIMLSANRTVLFLPLWSVCLFPFFPFPFMIVLAGMSSAIFSKSEERSYPCLVCTWSWGKALHLPPLCKMLVVGFYLFIFLVGAFYKHEDPLLYSYFSECF